MKKPETGGRFVRDPKSKRLKQVQKPTGEAPAPEPEQLTDDAAQVPASDENKEGN